MSKVKKQAKQARKQLPDFDLESLREHLPKDFELPDLHFIRKREEEAASRGFMGGFLLGAIVGAFLALIFAPKRGNETREIVAGAAGDIKGKATELVHQVRSDEHSAGSPGEAVGDAVDSAKEAAEDTKGDLQKALDDAAAKNQSEVSQAWKTQE
jgi:gas vesicle protein